MLKDMMGKLNDAVPENLKDQAKENLKEAVTTKMEDVKSHFLGKLGDSAASSTVGGTETPVERESLAETPTDIQSSTVDTDETASIEAAETADVDTAPESDSGEEKVA
jgi:hypothetical protein